MTYGTPLTPRVLAITGATVALVFGNLLDGMFTLVLLQLRLAHEMNPLMRVAYEHSPLAFMLAKLSFVQLGLLLLKFNPHARASDLAVKAGAALYTAIPVYHLVVLYAIPVAR